MMRIAILISGRGSNMLSLADEVDRLDGTVEICLVASNTNCAGIVLARERGLETAIYDRKSHQSREGQENALAAALERLSVDFIFLAGYMAILSADFVNRFPHQIINIHPSLLPAFKGLNTHERAIKDGVSQHGVSVHLVTAALDDGPLLAQAALDILSTDTPETLANRVLDLEHAIYPTVLNAISTGHLRILMGTPNWSDDMFQLEGMPIETSNILKSALVWPVQNTVQSDH